MVKWEVERWKSIQRMLAEDGEDAQPLRDNQMRMMGDISPFMNPERRF
jgi:hypothetical protein